MAGDTKLVSLRLRSSTREHLKQLSVQWDMSQADVITLALATLAHDLGMRQAGARSTVATLNQILETTLKNAQEQVDALGAEIIRVASAPPLTETQNTAFVGDPTQPPTAVELPTYRKRRKSRTEVPA